ncbi:MAG TPA: PadR family transcriptional regulator [Bryobacteraceae bacterium]|jgi:transcriptional regulator
MPRETLQGTLDLLILKTLARGSEHGYGITCAILNASQNQLRVEEGSLYPALRRLETGGLIKAEWRASENNRRARYYELTRKGRRKLDEIEEQWRTHAAAVESFLAFE